MSCCGGSPVSRMRREAKSLSAPLMRNCVFSGKAAAAGAAAGGDMVEGTEMREKPLGSTEKTHCDTQAGDPGIFPGE